MACSAKGMTGAEKVPRFNTPPGEVAAWVEFRLPVKFRVAATPQRTVGVEVAVEVDDALGVFVTEGVGL